MKKTALLIVVAAASMHGMTAAVPTPPVKIAGAIGERFDLTVRGNFMKLDLEKDFFRPFKDRSSRGGFIGLGKLADAAVHLAWNSGEAASAPRCARF